jgi:hypothetical protein
MARLWAVVLLAIAVESVDVVYVTDVEIYTYLVSASVGCERGLTDVFKAPCASSAISYQVGLETYSTKCGEEKTALQSCICRNTNGFNQLTSAIYSDISTGCGTQAGTSDAWSASQVMDKYCNPDKTITFATPTANKVNAFITELPQLSNLPSCAQSGLSYAVVGGVRDHLWPAGPMERWMGWTGC